MALAMLIGAPLPGCQGDKGKAGVKAVNGYACGYYVNLGLLGGPQQLRGCGQPANAPPTGASPSVTLPFEGSDAPIKGNDPDGAAASYGRAVILGGTWPEDVASTPPSGPISVSTQGTRASGTVTSSADIGLNPTPVMVGCSTGFKGPCTAPGGFGPFPVEGDELHVTCTATEKEVTGSTTFKNATHGISTTADEGPKEKEPVPDNPPPNYTRSGVITDIGGVFTAVYNEQILNADGSLTVNGVHMYLFGPTAVGEVIKGQVRCGMSPPATQPADSLAPGCGTLYVAPIAPDNPTPKAPRTELVGVFDAGGLEAIDSVKVTNGKVDVGNPSGLPYLRFAPGQTGPLAVTATRTDEAEKADLPLEWSFDAVDKAGNRVHCPNPSTTP